MPAKQSDDSYSQSETAQRMDKVLRGAFAGPPTPLKKIPKVNGDTRSIARRATPKAQQKSRKNTKASA